ncbi:MAG: transcriptional repressor [Actinobacteria bacterium]|nr:transcriptional repressor [Actinomycetota bacterium]
MTAPAQDELTELLRQKGVRVTPQRVAVLAELAREADDATAQQLWQRLRESGNTLIGVATVYRTLAVLVDHRVIDVLAHHGHEHCYRLCTDAHHHHLLCDRCHKVVEIHECDLGGWIDSVAARHGFLATEHKLEITGRCAACREAAA